MEAVAHIVPAIGRHLHIDCEHERIAAGAGHSPDQLRDGTVLSGGSLKPGGRPTGGPSSGVNDAPLTIIGMWRPPQRASTRSP